MTAGSTTSGEGTRKAAKWVKAHIICGVQTNVVVSAEVKMGNSADSPQLPGLVNDAELDIRHDIVLFRPLFPLFPPSKDGSDGRGEKNGLADTWSQI